MSEETVTCPRPGCRTRVVKSHDELLCLEHGTFSAPLRPWERHVPETFERPRRDMQEPAAVAEVTVTNSQSLPAEITADVLVAMLQRRFETLKAQVEKAERAIASSRNEAERLVAALAALGQTVELPESLRQAKGRTKRERPIGEPLRCTGCEREFATLLAMSIHRTRMHGGPA